MGTGTAMTPEQKAAFDRSIDAAGKLAAGLLEVRKTISVALDVADDLAAAVIEAGEGLRDAFDEDGDDGEPALPVVSIADAEPVRAGEMAECLVTLDKAGSSEVRVTGHTVGWGLDDWTDVTTIAPGSMNGVLLFPTPANAAGQFAVHLDPPLNATLGRSTATGTILAAEPPPEPGEPELGEQIAALWTDGWHQLGPNLQAPQMTIALPPTPWTFSVWVMRARETPDWLGIACAAPPGVPNSPQGFGLWWEVWGGLVRMRSAPPPFGLATVDLLRKPTLLTVAWTGHVLRWWRGSDRIGAMPLDAVPSVPLALGESTWDDAQPDGRANPFVGWMFSAAVFHGVVTDDEVAAWAGDGAPDPPVEPEPEPEPEPGNGGNGTLEPVDTTAHQVAISVGTAPRQTIIGLGWGANSAKSGAAQAMFGPTRAHIAKLSTGINAKVLRIFTPENPGFLPAYKPYWDLCKQHGFTDIFASCYVHASDPDTSMAAVAQGVRAYHDAGVPIGYISLQNEPDGGSGQAVPGGGSPQVNNGNAASVRERYISLRGELDQRGLHEVKILSYEWRHPTTHGPGEYDKIATLVPDVVFGSCYHIYDKGPNAALLDDRYMRRGADGYSTETGNNGSPNCGARGVSGVNNGSRMEIIHYAVVTSSASEPMQQGLITADGTGRPWYGQLQAIWTNLQQGSTVFLCESSDRPPGMPADQARRMEILAPRMPRACVAAARRQDGRWQLVAVSTAYGTASSSNHVGGHYGAMRQQLTVTIPQLAGKAGTWIARRAAQNSTEMTGPSAVQMDDGRVRFTLAPGESLGATQQ